MIVDWGDGGWQWFLVGGGVVAAALIILWCFLAMTDDEPKATGDKLGYVPLQERVERLEKKVEGHLASTNPHQLVDLNPSVHYGSYVNMSSYARERFDPVAYNRYTMLPERFDRDVRKVINHWYKTVKPFVPESPDQV